MKGGRERKLPVQQLSILAICRFAEPIASTSLLPYLPEMIESFGVPINEVGWWAGICVAMFSLFQALVGIPWGRFSDIYGRKPAILLGLTSTMLTSLMWGFSKNLPVAIASRALAGAGNGNVGIIRTTVAEMVPFKELQPRAFSIMPLVWNVGSIFGPTIGGALSNPLRVKPGERIENPNFLEVFPYALPNIVSAAFFTIGIITGFLFLHETLDTLQGRRDYGLILGRKLTGFVRSQVLKLEELLRFRDLTTKNVNRETDPLLIRNGKDVEDDVPVESPRGPPLLPPSFREVLTKQSILNLIVYTFLAMHTMAYDQLLPVFMRYPSMWTKNPYVVTPGSTPNPLQFSGGFGLESFQIGVISTCYGVCGMLIQFFIFPPVARKLGVLRCLKWCSCVFPVAYFLMPFTALLPTQEWQVGAAFGVMMLKCFCGIFAYPCSTILITNSASSLRVLGTLNGFATSVAAIGRAAGPAIGGAIWTVGVEHGFVIAPWWLFTAVAVLAAIPVFWLVEGEGFGGDDEVSDEEAVEEEVDVLRTEGLENVTEASWRPRPVLVPSKQQAEEEEQEVRDEAGGLLTRTNTMSSAGYTIEDGSEISTASVSRTGSRVEQPTLGRRNSRRVMRTMSIPLGMGRQGLSRRYSSNLGQSFGTSGTYNG